MEQKKIDRINELAAKVKKGIALTSEETAERAELRREYLEAIRADFKRTLNSIEYTD